MVRQGSAKPLFPSSNLGGTSIWRSRVVGRARTIGNRVTVKSGSRVRIHPLPPEKSTFVDTKKSSLYEVTSLFAKAVNPLFTGVLGFFSFCASFSAIPENLLLFLCCFALAFIVRCFETSPYLGGFTQNIKSCTGSRLYKMKKTHSRKAVRLVINLS